MNGLVAVATAVTASLVVIILEHLLLSWRRARARRDLRSGELLLEYGKGLKAFFTFGTLFLPVFLLMLVIIELEDLGDFGTVSELVEDWPWLIFGLLLMGLPMSAVIEVYGVRHKITKIGIEKHSPWSRNFTATWDEVQSITYSSLPRWLVVRTSFGVIRLHDYIDGLGDFARAVMENVPEHKWANLAGEIRALAFE